MSKCQWCGKHLQPTRVNILGERFFQSYCSNRCEHEAKIVEEDVVLPSFNPDSISPELRKRLQYAHEEGLKKKGFFRSIFQFFKIIFWTIVVFVIGFGIFAIILNLLNG